MDDRPTPRVSPPTLAGYLRTVRNERGISRDQLAAAAAVSSSYIAQLETGEKTHPSPRALQALATALGFGSAELRHACDLAQLPESEWRAMNAAPQAEEPIEDITAGMREAIGHLPCLAAYIDPRWNILATNDGFAAAFPGVVESGNVLRWLITCPAAKRVMVEWEAEAEIAVHWFRGLIAAQHDSRWTTELLNELAHYPEFVKIWADEHFTFGRDRPYMHMRDAVTDELYTIDARIYSTLPGSREPVQICIGIRLPYSGPSS